MSKYEYKSPKFANHSLGKALSDAAAEGWEFVEIVERVSPPSYANGATAGPGASIVLLRKPIP